MQISALLLAASLSGGTAAGPPARSNPDLHHSHHQLHTASSVIAQLNLTASAEKGYFAETFRDAYDLPCADNRSASTAIYYLLEGKESPSLWHTVDEAEVWHWYAGAPLSLYISDDSGEEKDEIYLGGDIFFAKGKGGKGGKVMRPQGVVPRGKWQRARSWGDWTLVGTTVAPGFEVSGSVIKPEGWQPGDD